MENASKALLIAGAILIVILLIAVGMMVYNSASGTIKKAIGQMSTTDKQIHNTQFERFLGENVSGTNIRQLFSTVIANNANEDNLAVGINYDGSATTSSLSAVDDSDMSSTMTDVSTSASAKYTVTAEYTEGVITTISIDRTK